MEDGRGILSAISDQIIYDIVEDNSGHSYRCIMINEWTLSKVKGQIMITGEWDGDDIPPHPNWIDFTVDQTNFKILTPASFFLEIITLLYEVSNYRENKKDSKLSELLINSLFNLRNRWRVAGEPLRRKEQMRLIGELIPVIEVSKIVGSDAINSWDSDGRALYDITSERWVIEAKATSRDPESVWVSDPAQLDHRIDKSIYLSVTKINSTKDGKTFPELIDELLEDLSREQKSTIKAILNTQGYSEELRNKYKLRWIVHGTRYLPIDSSSPVLQCSIFDNRPSEVMKITYQLKTAEMNDVDIKKVLS